MVTCNVKKMTMTFSPMIGRLFSIITALHTAGVPKFGLANQD